MLSYTSYKTLIQDSLLQEMADHKVQELNCYCLSVYSFTNFQKALTFIGLTFCAKISCDKCSMFTISFCS